MKNIILIGMPGCGKSTLGRRLAGALHRSFVDADTYLEEKEGKPPLPDLLISKESEALYTASQRKKPHKKEPSSA